MESSLSKTPTGSASFAAYETGQLPNKAAIAILEHRDTRTYTYTCTWYTYVYEYV